MIIRVGLVGCGTVGSGLIELLNLKSGYLKERFDVEFKLMLVSDSFKGTISSDLGLDTAELVANLKEHGNILSMAGAARESGDLAKSVRSLKLDILCEATPTDYKTGLPGMSILKTALGAGVSAVTSSKGAISLDLEGLKKLARENGVFFRYESSVLSGTPLISLVRGPLAGCAITRVEGIVNGTTNYILTKMEEGMDYSRALAEAQKFGYAETDPAGDVEGIDSALKVCIMAAEFFETRLSLHNVSRRGITQVTSDDISLAKSAGGRIKLIAGVERNPGGSGAAVRGYVELRTIDISHPLAFVTGVANAVNILTDNLGEITIVGPGAGKRETAQGILSDMLDIASRLSQGCGK
ncbi:MAG: homoserine dehydrogenase [Synergistaceae bacterium]|jgi:homoserine dehydrogenase|nr:homoserine dehydrogenase [Synergistaceae bacterium]